MSLKPISINNKKRLGVPTQGSITPKGEKSLTQYFQDIKSYSIDKLTKEEEKTLFDKIAQGDQRAKDKIVTSNLKFVISVAKTYNNQGLPFEDLINEGNIGLIKAVDHFDSEKGFKFISYAVWWIRQSILEALVHKGKNVRVPVNKRESLNKVNKMINKLEQKLHRKPTIQEIIEASKDTVIIQGKNGIDIDDLTTIMTSNVSEVSLDEPLTNGKSDESFTLHDTIPAVGSDVIPKIEKMENEIRELLGGLKQQERNIIEMCFGVLREKRYNLEEISELYSISGERVRQIRDTAIQKLRDNPKISILFDYMA